MMQEVAVHSVVIVFRVQLLHGMELSRREILFFMQYRYVLCVLFVHFHELFDILIFLAGNKHCLHGCHVLC